MFSNTKIERGLWGKGFKLVAGLDEVGYGAWVGPVVAGVVVWRQGQRVNGIRDSKMLRAETRVLLARKIREMALGWAVGEASVEEILELGLGKARDLAMVRALEKLSFCPDYLLIDAVKLKWGDVPFDSIIKGDKKSVTIGAASIVAKVYRDSLMNRLHRLYRRYGWNRNKGYGTKFHQEMIDKFGITGQHRSGYKCFDTRRDF